MIEIIYFVVILIATFLGASAGLGGGVIIKPVLDFVGADSLSTISFLSTSSVFAMALYSTIKQIKNKVKFDYTMIMLIAIGAMVGGNLGESIFAFVLQLLEASHVKFIQAIMLAILLFAVLINMKSKHITFPTKNKYVILMIGLLLGLLSTFLGIGGGPINVAVFVFFFSIDLKKATVYSIATILFSQGSKLVTIAMSTGFSIFDLSLLLYSLPAAIIGGIIGTHVNKKMNEEFIHKIFTDTVVFVILLNVYNAISIFF